MVTERSGWGRTIRERIQRVFHDYHVRRSHMLSIGDLKSTAIIFAPHPDDEVLACGGTICLKRKANVRVKVVFVTDGAASHCHLMPRDELRRLRRAEAIRACSTLGVEENDVEFMDCPDSGLEAVKDDAIYRAAEILSKESFSQVFIPAKYDYHSDHISTHYIVKSALKKIQYLPAIFDYSVYAWGCWPWCSSSDLGLVSKLLNLGITRRFVREFTNCVDISSVREIKMKALLDHSSQMTNLIQHPAWWDLSRRGDGDFVHWSTCPYEFFYSDKID